MATVSFREIADHQIGPIVRLYISGSSGSGKTKFVCNFLKKRLFEFTRIYYYHPDCQETLPTDWHSILSCEVIYKSDSPTIETFKEMKPYSVIVLDDIFDKVVSSYDIDYLFRVLSGKRKLHVIVMSQRYFSTGRYCLSIRNCCDYHVLMRNSDLGTTKRIARTLGHEKEISTALKLTETQLYPYIFIDKTHLARVNRIQVYIDILSQIKVVIIDSMKYYLLSEKDFLSTWKKIDKNLAQEAASEAVSTEVEFEPDSNGNSDQSTVLTGAQRKCVQAHVKRTLHRYKKRSKFQEKVLFCRYLEQFYMKIKF